MCPRITPARRLVRASRHKCPRGSMALPSCFNPVRPRAPAATRRIRIGFSSRTAFMPREGRSAFNASKVHAARHLPQMRAVLRSRPLRMPCRNADLLYRSLPRSIVPALKNSLPPATLAQAVCGPAGKTETWQPVDAGHIGALVKALARNVFEAHMSTERSPGMSNWEAWKIGAFTAKA